MRRRAASLLLGVLLAGCFLAPDVECDDTGWEPGLTCAGVMAAARRELAGTAGVSRLSASLGRYCGTQRGCPFTPVVVTVFADVVDGRRLFVTVVLGDDGLLHSEALRAVDEVP